MNKKFRWYLCVGIGFVLFFASLFGGFNFGPSLLVGGICFLFCMYLTSERNIRNEEEKDRIKAEQNRIKDAAYQDEQGRLKARQEYERRSEYNQRDYLNSGGLRTRSYSPQLEARHIQETWFGPQSRRKKRY